MCPRYNSCYRPHDGQVHGRGELGRVTTIASTSGKAASCAEESGQACAAEGEA
jgi:hypothetical protein